MSILARGGVDGGRGARYEPEAGAPDDPSLPRRIRVGRVNPPPLIELRDVAKAFGPVRVIDGVTLTVRPGEVHALLGENGAGKSTLIKMMSGIIQPDRGRILIDEEERRLSGPRAAEACGIATIYQELTLVPHLSVAENILLGRLPRRYGLVDGRERDRRARAAMGRIGLDIDPATPVEDLGVARQQLVEIARALSMDVRLIILDEPTAALSGAEAGRLFEVMAGMREKGVGMVFISHHLDEIAHVADRVSVLRDGRLVAEVPPTTPGAELVRLMVGREIEEQYPARRVDLGPEVIRVEGLSSGETLHDVSLAVRAGEVVGLAGLMGAGRTELIRTLAGADRYDAGTVTVDGERLRPGDVRGAIRYNVGHVPEDRKSHGLVPEASVGENIGLATLGRAATLGIADRVGQRRRAGEVAAGLGVRMAGIDQPIANLSGGNQQKAIFARWVLAGSTVLLLDEPTRGVDVGAKVEIYDIINRVAAEGGAVLMASSDLPEVLGMSDRILVMAGGRIVGELGRGATQDDVMRLAVRQAQRTAEKEGDVTP